MIIKKTAEEIVILREGGRRLAEVVDKVAKKVTPGISTLELDEYAFALIKEYGDSSAFLGYTPEGISYPYPATLCVSINNEVVHGIPKKENIIRAGDMVKIDCGLKHKGLYTDHAVTVIAGKGKKEEYELIEIADRSLAAGIAVARVGARTGDIGFAIQQIIRPYGFGIIKELSGHGVGKHIHEDPYVPNYGKPGTGALLEEGMVIAIEPMITMKSPRIRSLDDEYTIVTADGSRAAHVEHTIAITKDGPVILTVV